MTILRGNADALPLADESVHCVVTSPPYWRLRDYGADGQIGREETPQEYVAALVGVFREVWRVLRLEGTVWLNLGDCYGSGAEGLKPKDLVGIPWRVALALQADGWWLRSDVIWEKPNAMPESVRDRPTCAHEHVFLLTKSPRYYYDAEAAKEPAITTGRWPGIGPQHAAVRNRDEMYEPMTVRAMRNRRDVWTMPTQPYRGAHFATMPEALAEVCIRAGSPVLGVVLDPFAGAGTTVLVAQRLGRTGIGVELSADYCRLARERCYRDAPLLAYAARGEA